MRAHSITLSFTFPHWPNFSGFFSNNLAKYRVGTPAGGILDSLPHRMTGINKETSVCFFFILLFYSMFVWAPVKFYTALKLRKESTVYKLQLTNQEMSISQKGSVTDEVLQFQKLPVVFVKHYRFDLHFLIIKIFFLQAYAFWKVLVLLYFRFPKNKLTTDKTGVYHHEATRSVQLRKQWWTFFKSLSFHPHNLYVALSTQYNVNYKMKINKTWQRSMYTHIAVA